MTTLESKVLAATQQRADFWAICRHAGMCNKPIEVCIAIDSLMKAGKLRFSAMKTIDGDPKYQAV